MDSSALSTNTLIAVQDTAREHSSKVIGRDFPESGYGISSAPLASPFYPTHVHFIPLSTIDEFYVFEKDAVAPVPSRISEIEFLKADLIQAIIRPREKREPVVELSSDKSGIKLAFSTNRMLLSFFR